MAVSSAQVTVTTSPTVVFGPDVDGAWVHLRTDNACYFGNSTVTIANGYELPKDEGIDLFVGPGETIYGIVAAETNTVWVLATLNQ